MPIDITVLIGGEAGQGILTVGELVTSVCHRSGLTILANNEFESRIRGGHSFTQIRICDAPVHAPSHRLHLLVSLDENTFDLHRDELVSGGVAILEKEGTPDGEKSIHVSFSKLGQEAGGQITSNTVAAGACLALLGAPFDTLSGVLRERFASKGDATVDMNVRAATLGYEAVSDIAYEHAFQWQRLESAAAVMDGARAIALGALAADCRMAAFYPMSPATGIMAALTSFADRFPLVIEQAEDEIAAINMAIGASFAGVRSMTATSGGGFCLMTEGLGLAGITETPLVIVNAQRPGPATGLATRTAQGDLLFAIRASQDEFPRFVFAPGTPAEAFETTARAFHLSEKYQVPAIILADKYFTDTLFTETEPFPVPEEVERFVVRDSDIEDISQYGRYTLTPSGISPRALPCMGEALVIASGNEHREDGHNTEEKHDRIRMVEKRNAKITGMLQEMRPPKVLHSDSEILLVGWGSTGGAIREAADMLRDEGVDAGSLVFSDLWPFPADAVEACINEKQQLFMVELNSSGQLGTLIREQTGLRCAGTVLKYDGRPFYPVEIADGIKKHIGAA